MQYIYCNIVMVLNCIVNTKQRINIFKGNKVKTRPLGIFMLAYFNVICKPLKLQYIRMLSIISNLQQLILLYIADHCIHLYQYNLTLSHYRKVMNFYCFVIHVLKCITVKGPYQGFDIDTCWSLAPFSESLSFLLNTYLHHNTDVP